MNSKIAAVSYLLPEKILTNDELAALFPDNTAHGIFRKTGISERRIFGKDTIPSDFSVNCFNKFLQEHPEVNKDDIDFLLFCCSI